MNITDLTITEIIHLLSTNEVSSRELTTKVLEKIHEVDDGLHSFLHVSDEFAMQQAEKADNRRKNEPDLDNILCGIPLAVKDVLTVADLPCTCGSRILEGYIPPHTATAVKRLQDAGMVVIGKTNTDEFAMGSSTENSAYGVTHNPWDYTRVPGGSSGGSAAAVSAKLVPAALGTDTGGSVRQPASFCSLTGIKPTYGRVSRYGLIAYGSSLDSCGVLAHSVEDVVPIFKAMAGVDSLDATSRDVTLGDLSLRKDPDLRGIRIGVPKEYFISGMQKEVEEKVRDAIEVLRKLGAEIKEVSLPHTEFAVPVYYLIAPAEASANLARYDGIRFGPRVDGKNMWDVFTRTRGEKFGDEVTRRIMLGTYALSAGYYDAYYGQAQKVRTLIKQDFEKVYKEVDAIACPVAPTTAFQIGVHNEDPLAMYLEDVFTLPCNLAGVPGLAFPAGFDHQGLPVGIQLMGRHFDEAGLFKIAHAYQQVTDWHKRSPKIG